VGAHDGDGDAVGMPTAHRSDLRRTLARRLRGPSMPRVGAPGRRARVARLERPLLLSGLTLVALHLLDLAFSGPATSALGVAAIVAVPVVWALAQPRVTRATRFALPLVVGLLALGFGVASHGLHALAAPDWRDLTGVWFAAGGVLLVASAVAALAAPRRPRRRPLAARVAHGAGWIAGAVIFAAFALMPFAAALMVTHAPRWPIHESALAVPHREVRIGGLAAWYVPPRNGVGVLLVHGSGGSRARVADRAAMLARHGYGVLALDLPGNGESHGHSNGLGDNAQPAVDRALDYLEAQPGVRRIAGFGVSLGAEVLIEAAARDQRIAALVADGATRPQDARRSEGGLERTLGRLQLLAVRGLSGLRTSPSLMGFMPRLAPRAVLLVAGGGFPAEIPANRAYQRAGGATVRLWERPGAGHTAGLKYDGREYERRTIGFLDGVRP
jgi:pimeloyl-ACP methyl ester carboxylesterase